MSEPDYQKLGSQLRKPLLIVIGAGVLAWGTWTFVLPLVSHNQPTAPIPTGRAPISQSTSAVPAQLPPEVKRYLAAHGILRVKGSTSAVEGVVKLSTLLKQQGITVSYLMTGSSKGVSALKAGNADIAISSETVTDPSVTVIALATDTVGVYTSLDNPVTTLTIEQVRGIFRGTITNWNEVGGPDAPIEVLQRGSGGTKDWWEKTVVQGAVTDKATVVPDGATELVRHVRTNRYAIGYGSISLAQSIVYTPTITGVSLDRQLYAVIPNSSPPELKQLVEYWSKVYGQ